MARIENTQVNVRSRFARERIKELAEITGKTATEIVEEALRAYKVPEEQPPAEGLVRRGPFWVIKSDGGPPITVEESLKVIDSVRDGRADDVETL